MSGLVVFDDSLRDAGFRIIAGVDEAGRGPRAGPVVAAAVVLPKGASSGDNDQKRLAGRKRFRRILRSASR